MCETVLRENVQKVEGAFRAFCRALVVADAPLTLSVQELGRGVDRGASGVSAAHFILARSRLEILVADQFAAIEVEQFLGSLAPAARHRLWKGGKSETGPSLWLESLHRYKLFNQDVDLRLGLYTAQDDNTRRDYG